MLATRATPPSDDETDPPAADLAITVTNTISNPIDSLDLIRFDLEVVDGDGQRVRTQQPNGVITYYPFPGYEEEVNGSTTTRRTVYHIAGQAVAVRVQVVGGNYNLLHLHNDHLGSNSVMSYHSGGGYVHGSRTRYQPFGDWRTAPTQAFTDIAYTGQRENMELGLYFYNARYYLPSIGRFASADTIVPQPEDPHSFNRYAYGLNNPIKYSDPTGHIACAGTSERCDPIGHFIRSRLNLWNPLSYSVTANIDGDRVAPPASSDMTDWLVEQMVVTASSEVGSTMRDFWQSGPINPIDKMGVLAAWTSFVRTGAVWDFKVDIERMAMGDSMVALGSHDLNFQVIANVFFGFVGRQIGMAEGVLQFGAGIAQCEHGIGHCFGNFLEYPVGFGDQEFDAWSIGFGFYLHELFGNDLSLLTEETFGQALDDYLVDNPIPSGP